MLPDGRVIVAFRDDAERPADRDRDLHVFPPPPAANYCGPPNAGLVGAEHRRRRRDRARARERPRRRADARASSPRAVASTVAWHASAGGAVRAFAAMSTNGGATFGPPQQIDPAGAGNQVAPELAATAGGRVDVAYLWDPVGHAAS